MLFNERRDAMITHLVPKSTSELQFGAELDQGLLECQVLCIVHDK